MEQPVMEALVNFLASRSDVTVYGPRVAEPGRRVPVVSFRAAGMPSAEISARLQVRPVTWLVCCAQQHNVIMKTQLVEQQAVLHTASAAGCHARHASLPSALSSCVVMGAAVSAAED